MKICRVLVVGGSGYLGQDLVASLLNTGHHITILDKQEISPFSHLSSYSIKYVCGDYSDPPLMGSLLDNIDIVFHLASTTIPHTSNFDPYSDAINNLIPSIKLIELCAIRGIKRFIYFSSGGTVYGESLHELIDENNNTNPICSYGIHKLTIEKYLNLFNKLYGLDFLILRISNIYGGVQNSDNLHGIIGTFIKNIKESSSITVIGDGNAIRDYIHIKDLISVITVLMEYRGNQKIFNIGTGIGTSINEIIQILIKYYNIPFHINYINKRGSDVDRNILDISRIRTETGWYPLISLEEYIKSIRDI
jgi:UDP-glucose 4-epimerase